MIAIQRIDLRFIRCLNTLGFDFGPGLNIIFGKNGSGKTTLLESLQVGLELKSFKTPRLQDLIQRGSQAGKIKINLVQDENVYSLGIEIHPRSKKLFINDDKTIPKKYSPNIIPIVLAPEHKKIISGSKQDRQNYLDNILKAQDPTHAQTVKKHKKITAHLLALIKQDWPLNTFIDQAKPWDQQNQNLSERIRKKRKRALETLLPLVQLNTTALSKGISRVNIIYQQPEEPEFSLDTLKRSFYAKRVLQGAQRDDLTMTHNGQPISKFGSQGEVATLLAAMKLAEHTLIKTNHQAILLLDDIGTTLDEVRRNMFLQKIKDQNTQCLLTTCDRWIVEQAHKNTPNTTVKNI